MITTIEAYCMGSAAYFRYKPYRCACAVMNKTIVILLMMWLGQYEYHPGCA